jgi:pimeloyl-ACP methyl ester carboxylesterase
MKKVVLGTAAVSALLAGGWLWAAGRAGTFLSDRSVVAASLDDPQVETFSRRKRYVDVGPWRVATIDEGTGDPVVLLHGCPFHAFEWRDVIPRLAERHRVIAPDLLGLGDTPVRLDQDYRLPQDVEMVVALLDTLGIERAHFVGHDHGGATVQIMMQRHPERIRSAILTNAEAYDAWPSEPERPYLELVVHPFFSPLFRVALTIPALQREVFQIAVHRKEAFNDEVLAAYTRAHTATPARWQRLVRFFRWQLDREHNQEPLKALDGMRRFTRPTLLLWGRQDTNFGPALAQRLAGDIPGTVRIEWFDHSAHMPMQEEPEHYAGAALGFFNEVVAWEREHPAGTNEVAHAEDR